MSEHIADYGRVETVITAALYGHRMTAKAVLDALTQAGYTIVRSDSWRLRSDFDVVPHNDGSVSDT